MQLLLISCSLHLSQGSSAPYGVRANTKMQTVSSPKAHCFVPNPSFDISPSTICNFTPYRQVKAVKNGALSGQ